MRGDESAECLAPLRFPLPVLGLASSALLFLLPVLYAAVRGGVGPGLFAALSGAVLALGAVFWLVRDQDRQERHEQIQE